MPPRDWLFRIADILNAIEAIQPYTSGMEFDGSVRDRRTVDAVVRNLIVIGEVANHVPSRTVKSHPEIPWTEMRALRNLVVHEYFGVSDRIVWDTVKRDLPPLVGPLRALVGRS